MTYRSQLKACKASGVAKPMTGDLFKRMNGDDKHWGEAMLRFWGSVGFDGLTFCSAKTGICCLKHCGKVTDTEIAAAMDRLKGEKE